MALNSKASCLCAHPKHWDCRRVPPCPVVFASSGYLISPRLLPSFLFVLLLFVSSLRGPRFLFCAGEWPSGQDITLAWIQKGQGIDKVLAKQLLGGLGTEWVFNYLFTLSPDWATPCFGCYFWMFPYIACVSWPHHAHIQYGHLSSWCPFVVYKDKHLQDLSLEPIKKAVEFCLSPRIESLVGGGG